jgi:YD repeat-containing protein
MLKIDYPKSLASAIGVLSFVAFTTMFMTVVHAQQQTRFYDARGNSLGTAVPLGQGTVRYYDARGNSLGTSTTTGNTTTFYGPRGNRTGSATSPAPVPSRGSGRAPR